MNELGQTMDYLSLSQTTQQVTIMTNIYSPPSDSGNCLHTLHKYQITPYISVM